MYVWVCVLHGDTLVECSNGKRDVVFNACVVYVHVCVYICVLCVN